MTSGLVGNLPATAAIVGAGLTAAFASFRFFSEKSAKITDFRKAWIETLRLGVAEFSANTHAIAGRVAIRSRHSSASGPEYRVHGYAYDGAEAAAAETAKPPTFGQEFESELLPHWVDLRLAYNKTILHLNPQEHIAYLTAEMALADYYDTTRDKADPQIVHRFLCGCLDQAYAVLTAKVETLPAGKAAGTAAATVTGAQQAPGTVRDPHQELLDKMAKWSEKVLPGEALLLAMFATRQLLHGPYDTLIERIGDIEHGIRVVDTAAAVVIKWVWAEIKHGEPTYRHISWISLVVSVVLLAWAFIPLLSDAPAPPPDRALKIHCHGQPAGSFLVPDGSAVNCDISVPG